ncbi:ATP-binding protein [Candidatus Margulisiibacteriota bacterium]
MKNPFYYGEAATGEYFTNRTEEIKSLHSDLSRGQNVIIFSPRRYGKTSLIKKVLGQLKKDGLLVVYADLCAATSKKKFIEILTGAIAKAIEGDISKIAKLLKQLLPRIIPKIIINTEGLPGLELEFKGTKRNISLILDELFELVPKFIKKKRKQAVIVLDEFQEILNFEDDEIERTFRSHLQFHKGISYVFMGSKKHLIYDMFSNPNRPFYKSGRMFPLQKIKAADFEPFIRKSFKNSGIEIDGISIKTILDISECHPYYTQLICSILWDRCIGIKKIGKVDITSALKEAIARSSAIYLEIFDNLTHPQKRLLEAISKDSSDSIYSKEFILENELGAATSIQRSIKALIRKGLVEKGNGDYIFSDIIFYKWLRAK